MDFGDEDDEEWDANELEALEVDAVQHYAATQRQPDSVDVSDQHRQGTGASHYAEDDDEVQERKRLEKLVQDKQGELLILKSNIARTSAEHATALDSARTAVRSVREDLSKQLEAYKDQVRRLETDLTFQRQELKDAKLRIAQATKGNQASPRAATRVVSRISAFPDKSAFQRDEYSNDQATRSRNKKRKRNGRLATETGLDEFDLAEVKSHRPSKSGDQGQDFEIVDNFYSIEVDQPLTPVRSPRPQTHGSVSPRTNRTLFADERDPNNPFGLAAVDILAIHRALLETYDPLGQNCMETLMRVTDGSGPSIGQSLTESLFLGKPPGNDPLELLKVLVEMVLSRLLDDSSSQDTFVKLLMLLQKFLRLDVQCVGPLVLENLCVEPTSLQTIFAHASRGSLAEAPTSMLHFLDCLASSFNREPQYCLQLLQQVTPSFYRTVATSDDDGSRRIIVLRCLAKLCCPESVLVISAEMLDVITVALDKEDLSLDASLAIRKTICQYLYCHTITSPDAMNQARRSRHVIPRLLRRLGKELFEFYNLVQPEPTMILIRMLVKLYHILLKDEDNATSEQHWRLPELRATHLTAMTRILYAEDDEGFDSETQDLAMDMLEMAVSPEEGNDIYEVMGGISTD